MKDVFKTLSLASVLCSQVSMTLYKQPPAEMPPLPSENVTAVKGEDVIFRCTIETRPGQQVVWRKGTEVLSAGPTLLKPDSRYSVTSPGNVLAIKSLASQDSGEFVCQVQTDQGLEERVHVLAIQVPAHISPVPQGGQVTARQGDTVSLRCLAEGLPLPTIAWHKSVGTAPGGHVACGGSCYTIPYVDLATSGDYICSAVNGVGHPSHATITLHVLYPPEVSCQSDQVQAGGGVSVVLGCFVHGEPSASVKWFRDGLVLQSDGKRFRTEWNIDKRMHSLVIVKSAEQDFGNYSCVASNLMGSSRCFMELNGRPFNLSFYSSEDPLPSPHYYQVRWRTSSHYKVERFTLLYRKVEGGGGEGDWTTVKIPGTGYHQTLLENSWILTNLSSSSTYECIIQAHNRYGWSSPSPIYVFQTADELAKEVSWDTSSLVSGAAPDNVRLVPSYWLLYLILGNFIMLPQCVI